MTNEKKSTQLKRSFGSACSKLRKAILFNCLVKLGENICFRCGESIVTADDLSIDHKVDWLDNNPDLFWDLDNIAFSHAKCNRKARVLSEEALQRLREYGHSKQIACPTGKAWCGSCRDFLSVKKFGKNSSRVNGLCTECKECRSKNRRKVK
jgi:hypothetical protein